MLKQPFCKKDDLSTNQGENTKNIATGIKYKIPNEIGILNEQLSFFSLCPNIVFFSINTPQMLQIFSNWNLAGDLGFYWLRLPTLDAM